MTRKLKLLIASLFFTGWIFLFNSVAHSDEIVSQTSSQVIDPIQTINTALSQIETATVTVQIIETTTATQVQTITPVIQISTTDALQAIETATATVQLAQTALENKISAQTAVETTTATVQSTNTIKINTSSILETATATVQTDTTNVSNKQSQVNSLQVQVDSTTVVSNGITATIYSDIGYNARPPLGAGTIVGTTTYPNIDFQWGLGGPLNGITEDFQIHFQGTFTPNHTGTMWLTPQADDGTILTIGNTSINDWKDKGGGGGTLQIQTVAGQSMPFDLWFYENGGGAFVQLSWYTDSGWQIVPSSAFNTVTVDQALLNNLNTAKSELTTLQNTLTTDNSAKQTAQTNYNNALTAYNDAVTAKNSAQLVLNQANSVLISALNAIAPAISDMQSSVSDLNNIVNSQLAAEEAARQAAIKAEQARLAAIEAARLQALEEARQAAAAAKAEQERLAAEAAAKAEADRLAAEAAAKAEADRLAAEVAAKAEADRLAAEVAAKAEADRLAAEAAAKAEADKAAADKAAADKAAADKAAADKAAADKAAADKAAADKAAADKAAAEKEVVNNPNQLSDTVVKEAPKEVLVAHIQQDKTGVSNGGIQFYGTKSAPQVVGEDGKLTPPAPPPGSGLPIPPDAITTADTFIGQPGGTSFNAPDIAVPVEPTYVCHDVTKDDGTVVHLDINGVEHEKEFCTYLPAALDAIPGAGAAVQAVGAAYAAMANIGNDMSPVTRKKAKKVLVITVVVGQIAGLRRRFG